MYPDKYNLILTLETTNLPKLFNVKNIGINRAIKNAIPSSDDSRKLYVASVEYFLKIS